MCIRDRRSGVALPTGGRADPAVGNEALAGTRRSVFFLLVPGDRWYPTLKPRQYFCMWYIIPHTKTKIIAHVHTCTRHTGTRGRIFFWYVSIRNSLRVRACAQTTATAAPDCNTSSSSSSVASRRWSRVLAPQRVNPALAVAVGRMFHTAAVTQ